MITAAAVSSVLAVIAAVLALVLVWRLPASTLKRGPLRFLLVATIVLGGVPALLLSGMRVQQGAAVDLRLPSTVPARAQEWMAAHSKEPPDRNQAGRNMRILADGMVFYRAYKDQLPPDASVQMEELSRIPPRPSRMLSVADEGRYYDAAKTVWTLMQQLGPPAPPPAEPAK